MDEHATDFGGCVLVFAHPDDEVLWASSVLAEAGQVIFCFGDVGSFPRLSANRRAAMVDLPLSHVRWLTLPEAEVLHGAAWPEPADSAYGLAIAPGPATTAGFSETRYVENYGLLRAHLAELLAGRGCVVTHNPWGEYGHEDHVQVFRVVADLQTSLGFELWVTGYVSPRSRWLMRRHLPSLGRATEPLPTNGDLAARLMAHYRAHGCWTWFADHRWPEREVFFRCEGGGDGILDPGRESLLHEVGLPWEVRRRSRAGPGAFLRRVRRRLARMLIERG